MGDGETGDGIGALQGAEFNIGEFGVVAEGRVVRTRPRNGLIVFNPTQEILGIANLFVMTTDVQPIPREHGIFGLVLPPA